MVDSFHGVDQFDLSDRLVEVSETKFGQEFPHFFGDEFKEVDNEFGFAGETSPQLRILGGDTNWTRVEMADTHHDAARDHERRRGESEFFSSEERSDDDVATSFELAVDLHNDPVAKLVQQKCLLSLCKSEFPRRASVFQGGQR
ncbi:unannotated protein [freshwater metagenome]|uniref:Unannotated protein n=1 Tax=freshwater metagenome TaxID=449393 RepID=A0A6J6S1Q7_9ZZZZ